MGATCKLVHGVMQGLCCCRGVLVPLCVGACVSKHGSSLVECVNARLLLRHIECNGFFWNVSASTCGCGRTNGKRNSRACTKESGTGVLEGDLRPAQGQGGSSQSSRSSTRR